jgi:hypothetical protein
MSLQLIANYQKALDAIYEHVGLKEDWVVCPLDDCTDKYWYTDGKTYVRYANTIKEFYDCTCFYEDEIYTQRFYPKWVYEGKDFTLIFCDPGVDGMKWWRLFDNKKQITLQRERKYKLDSINKK